MRKNRSGRIALCGSTLQNLRRKQGLSQERLAELCFGRRLQVSLSSIKRAETGHQVLYRIAAGLAEFYDVEVESLFAAPANDQPGQRVIEQLFQLSLVDQMALRVAAVFGERFMLEQLRFVLDLPDYKPDRLEGEGFIEYLAQRYAFQHDSVRLAVYDQLSRHARRDLNLRCARWYEERDRERYCFHIERAQ